MKVIIYNPKKGASIEGFLWLGKSWKLGVNELAKFPQAVATEMLSRYGFLVKIKPEDLQKTLVSMKVLEYQCKHCDYETDKEATLKAHMTKKHQMTEKLTEIMNSIPDAGDIEYDSVGKVKPRIDTEAGIPKGEKDGWYGDGLQKDIPSGNMKSKVLGRGNFGA